MNIMLFKFNYANFIILFLLCKSYYTKFNYLQILLYNFEYVNFILYKF